jgi:outer membrane protein TolC
MAMVSVTAAAVMAGHAAQARPNPDDPFAGAAHLDRAVLVAEVLRRNPSVEAAREAWRAARSRVAQERGLDDPMLSYEIAPLSLFADDSAYEHSAGRLGHTIQIEQRLPVPGARALRAEMAEAEAAMARESQAELELDLALAASVLHDDWYVVHRALDVNAHHIEVVQALRQSAEAQYVAGRASQQDPLRADAALAGLVQETIMLEARRDMIRAELNGLLHRSPRAALPPPPALAARTAEPPPGDALEALALRQRPALAGARAERAGRQAAVGLARRSGYPEVELMASYSSMWDETPHRYMVGVSVSLPIYRDRRRAAVDEARAGLSRSTHAQERLEDEVRVEVEKARQRLREAMRVAELHRTRLVPVSQERVAAARAGFESGRGGFAEVLEAENELRMVELAADQALADVSRRDAELARAIGATPGLPGRDAAP